MRSRFPALFACAVLAMPALGAASPDVSSNSRAGSISEPQTAAAAVAAVDAQPVRFEPNLGQDAKQLVRDGENEHLPFFFEQKPVEHLREGGEVASFEQLCGTFQLSLEAQPG